MAIEVLKEIVPRVNYKSELKELTKLNVRGYSGFYSKRLIYVSLVNSKAVIVYDLSRCTKNDYSEYIKVLRKRCF